MRTILASFVILLGASSAMADSLPLLDNSETLINPFQIAIQKDAQDLGGWLDINVYVGTMPYSTLRIQTRMSPTQIREIVDEARFHGKMVFVDTRDSADKFGNVGETGEMIRRYCK